MTTRREFSEKLSSENLSNLEHAIAFLWFYRQNQDYDERTTSELAEDMSDEGFARVNVSRLRKALRKTRYVVKGRRTDSFQLNLKYYSELSKKYSRFITKTIPNVRSSFIPFNWVAGTRIYLEELVQQINGCYDFGYFDGCIVLLRRLMESLIIDIYDSKSSISLIKDNNGHFFTLDILINHLSSNNAITLSWNSPKTMKKIKELGDAAAHNRFYITDQIDIDDEKSKIRRLIKELLSLAGNNP